MIKQLTITDITLHVEGGTGIKASLREGTWIQGALSLQYATVYAKGRERSITEIKDLDLVQCKILEPSGASWSVPVRSVVNEKGKYVPEVKIAPSYYFSIAGVEIKGTNVNQMNTLPGVEPSSELKYNPKTRTLTMKNVRMNLDNEAFKWTSAIHNQGCNDLTIEVLGDNEITSRSMTLFLQASTKIKGGGSLTLKSIKHTGVYIMLTTLSIADITLNVEGNKAIDGETNGNFTDLTLQNVTANIKGRRGAIIGLKSFKLEGGDMIAPVNGGWDAEKHAIMDGSNVANEVRIAGHWGLKPNILDEVPATGGTPSVTLTSKKSWTLALDPADATAWVTPSISNGTGNKTITFTVAKNKTPEARSVKAVFTQAETNRKLSLEIKQAEGESIFLLQPKTLEEVAKEGGAPSVTLTSNKPWTLTLDPADATAWVTPSASNGTGTQEVTFTVAKNEATTPRTVVVTFKQAETEKELQLTITQGAAESVQVPLIGISFTESNISLKVGMSTTLVVKYNPDNATNKEVTWEVTEGATSLSVDANGKITATNVAGTAKVKATSKDGGHTAECTVTVTAADVPVESISVSPAVVNLTVGGTQQLSVSVNPRTATNQTATWAVTAGAGIVSVNGTGLVKALKAGTATVTATVGGKTATCTVNVKAKDVPTVPKAVEDAVLASVVVAPNPFSSQLRIVNPESVALRYELVTLTGNVVRAGALDGTETVVDTEALPAGLYFVCITGQNDAKKAVKVIKY